MKISGFTFMRNTEKLYYPFLESVLSILDIVDEFVIVIGKGDDDDTTKQQIINLNNPKIKLINSVWDLDSYAHGSIYAQQTDLAKSYCSGDWLFYLQSDELIHEQFLPKIKSACEEFLHIDEVEGLLFKWKHFFGDYDHFLNSHSWYKYDIRIIKNRTDIHSWKDAQSFRRIPNFDGMDYYRTQNTYPLKVKLIDAEVYHYGWVRPPRMMQIKSDTMSSFYHSGHRKEEFLIFDYGNLSKLERFEGTHPKVMDSFIAKMDWKSQLHYEPNYMPSRKPLKHEKLKYRILSWIENKLLKGRMIFGYKNWKII
ncbi:MAG TPA: hypothetical protein PK006_00715 [Saprospiraceae bacterium]|nr:hypothetical protein [Saprospiraceae bacterium]